MLIRHNWIIFRKLQTNIENYFIVYNSNNIIIFSYIIQPYIMTAAEHWSLLQINTLKRRILNRSAVRGMKYVCLWTNIP